MFILKSIAVLAVTLGYALAESHTVHFTNLCKFGTAQMFSPLEEARISMTGIAVFDVALDYTRQGPLLGAIAYLQTGGCGFNGEGCTLVELSLTNGFSSADISLIPPHAFSVTSGFGYYNGCDGTGTDCQEPNCPQAFENPDETWKQIPCPAANVNLAVTFCD